jgi:hypothetical protein
MKLITADNTAKTNVLGLGIIIFPMVFNSTEKYMHSV